MIDKDKQVSNVWSHNKWKSEAVAVTGCNGLKSVSINHYKPIRRTFDPANASSLASNLTLLFHPSLPTSHLDLLTMSQAHRPTWNPTLGRETKVGSQQVAKLSLAAHTKLKFRQPGQNTSGDIVRRDLKAELAAAERVAAEKKRKAAGLPPSMVNDASRRIENGSAVDPAESEEGEGESVKRRKVLEEALEMDKDDSDDEDEEEEGEGKDKGKGKALDQDADDDEEDEEDDDDE